MRGSPVMKPGSVSPMLSSVKRVFDWSVETTSRNRGVVHSSARYMATSIDNRNASNITIAIASSLLTVYKYIYTFLECE